MPTQFVFPMLQPRRGNIRDVQSAPLEDDYEENSESIEVPKVPPKAGISGEPASTVLNS